MDHGYRLRRRGIALVAFHFYEAHAGAFQLFNLLGPRDLHAMPQERRLDPGAIHSDHAHSDR